MLNSSRPKVRLAAAPTTLLLCVAACVGAPAAAQAATVKCPGDQYELIERTPPVRALVAKNLPAKTDGYAPRCLVAEQIASLIQDDWDGNKGPATLQVYGARWLGGKWYCTYRDSEDVGEHDITCKKAGLPSRRVEMSMAT